MKNSTLVVVLLAGLNVAFLLDAYCVIDWIGKDCGTVVPGNGCACDDGKRYRNEKDGGGTQVSLDESRSYLANFQRVYNTPHKGAFISKRVLDDVFCRNQEANGVFCYFGLTNESPESFVLLLEDGKRDETLIQRSDAPGHAVFMSGTMCPAICGLVGE